VTWGLLNVPRETDDGDVDCEVEIWTRKAVCEIGCGLDKVNREIGVQKRGRTDLTDLYYTDPSQSMGLFPPRSTKLLHVNHELAAACRIRGVPRSVDSGRAEKHEEPE